MEKNSTQGVSLKEVAAYLTKHFFAVAVWTVVISVVTFAAQFFVNSTGETEEKIVETELEDYKKDEIEKLARLYSEYWDTGYVDKSIPIAERVDAGYKAELIRRNLTENEAEYFNKVLGIENKQEDTTAAPKKPVASMLILSIGFGVFFTIGVSIFKCIGEKETNNA